MLRTAFSPGMSLVFLQLAHNKNSRMMDEYDGVRIGGVWKGSTKKMPLDFSSL